jgi:hypothetical protein
VTMLADHKRRNGATDSGRVSAIIPRRCTS